MLLQELHSSFQNKVRTTSANGDCFYKAVAVTLWQCSTHGTYSFVHSIYVSPITYRIWNCFSGLVYGNSPLTW